MTGRATRARACSLWLALVCASTPWEVRAQDGFGASLAKGTTQPTAESKPDPRQLLRDAIKAVMSVDTLVYQAEFLGSGAMADKVPRSTGTVGLSRLPMDDPIGAKVSVEGETTPLGTKNVVKFRSTYDGRIVRILFADRKAMVVETTKAAGQTAVLFTTRAGVSTILLQDYLQPVSLSLSAVASTVLYEGTSVTNGELCDVIWVQLGDDAREGRFRWFIGHKDHLPRRRDRLTSAGGEPGALVLSMSDLRLNEAIPDDAFTIVPPPWYRTEPIAPPTVPTLLNVGAKPPDWTLKDVNGKSHSLRALRGKLVVLYFWAGSQGASKPYLHGLEALHREFAAKGLAVVGINTPQSKRPVGSPGYMKSKGYTFPLLMDGDPVAQAYNAAPVPTVYLLDRTGTIVYQARGRVLIDTDARELRKIIEQQLGQEK